eukprot:s174_g3.t1
MSSGPEQSHAGQELTMIQNPFDTAARRRAAVEHICSWLKSLLGFQTDSMRNQAEHVEALWESFLRRYQNPNVALQVLSSQLLRTQRDWRAKVWIPLISPLSPSQQQADPLRDVCLYWLIWGELGNLRFCPELICFLVTAASEVCVVATECSSWSAHEGSFVEEVVKPIYRVMMAETFEVSGVAPKFKFGKAPAPARACNYDDWNELFWDPRRLKRALKLKDSGHNFLPACSNASDVWQKLPTVDWERSLRNHKTHLEFHSHLPLLIGNYRIYLLHSLVLCSLLCWWVVHLGHEESLGRRLWYDWGWLMEASLGLIAPAWMLLFQLGFQGFTPCLARRNRFRGLLQLIFIDMLPVASFAVVVLQYNSEGGTGAMLLDIKFIHMHIRTFDALLVLHVFCSVFALVLALGPRSDNLYRWRFYPTLTRPECMPQTLFWAFTLGLWAVFVSSGTMYCAHAIVRIWDVYDSLFLSIPQLLVVLNVLVLVPTALVFFSTLCFFLNFAIAIVGTMVGAYRLGGMRLMCTRRGLGLTYLPETLVGRILHLPNHASTGATGLLERMTWWRRMSDMELQAFVDVWNKLLDELRGRDLLCHREHEFLKFGSVEEARQGRVPRLFQAMSLNALPANLEARRRIVTLARSVQMDPLPSAPVKQMPTLSVLIPHYSETIRYSKQDLFSDSVSNDLLRFLIKYYRDEFRNLIERLEGADSESRGPNWLEAALCEWASLRMQTLWRTVDGIWAALVVWAFGPRGICHAYGHALQTLAKHQTLGDSIGFGEELVRQRLQVVIAMQQYAKFSDPDSSGFNPQHLDAVEAMFSTFGDWLSIAYIEEQEGAEGRRYFSCLIDSSCMRHEVGEGHFARAPKFRIELPGFPILGHGKSDNQNCAVIFTRRGRPGIVGFREHIFSAVGLLGRIAADSEFTFGTMIQRTLDWPLNARLHYGHPDLMDKLQVVQQGGVSKGTKGLNLSEDVFAGLDLSLRGGWTVYREYFHVGKGRDMGFMSVLSFYAKVSMGNAEQAITRQWMRLGLHLELPQLLGVFYSHIGFYVNQCLVNRATKAFCFTAAFFTLAGEVRKPFMDLAVEMVSSYFGYFYLLFVLASMLPYFAETMLEEGGLSACYNLASSLLACSPIFSAFQSKLMAHFFETTLNYGGAQNFRCFAPTHLYDAMEVIVLLVFSAGVDYGAGFYLCTAFSSAAWVVSPLLFNPRNFESKSQALRDISEWMLWMTNSEPKEEASWCAWQISLQEVRRNKSLMSCIIGKCRFMAVLCTVALILSVFPPAATIHQLRWLSILLYCPPFFHGVICLLLSMVFCSSAASRVPYVLMAPLAAVVTVLEMAFLINQVSWSLLFYKYVCLRWMLEAADGIAALRPGRVVLAPLHDACRIWAFSWRFLRDAAIGIAIGLACLAMACIPGLNYLHTLFLFRTRRPKEEGLAEEAEDSTAALDRLDEGVCSLHAQALRKALKDFDCKTRLALKRILRLKVAGGGGSLRTSSKAAAPAAPAAAKSATGAESLNAVPVTVKPPVTAKPPLTVKQPVPVRDRGPASRVPDAGSRQARREDRSASPAPPVRRQLSSPSYCSSRSICRKTASSRVGEQRASGNRLLGRGERRDAPAPRARGRVQENRDSRPQCTEPCPAACVAGQRPGVWSANARCFMCRRSGTARGLLAPRLWLFQFLLTCPVWALEYHAGHEAQHATTLARRDRRSHRRPGHRQKQGVQIAPDGSSHRLQALTPLEDLLSPKDMSSEYTGAIGVGTAADGGPQFKAHVVFDTGSTNLWVASVLCKVSPCNEDRSFYDPAQSMTSDRRQLAGYKKDGHGSKWTDKMPQQGRNEVNRDIREATADEISAAKEKQRLSEEEGHAKSLWDKAAERTVVDPNRPLYARELLASGKMRDWWSPSWRDVKELVDGEAPRGSGGFEALAEKRRSQRRRQAEKVVAQRISSSRAVAEAHGALGRFLDKRAGSVQEASCAASDAQGRLQRLQEQSKGARAVALRNAQAQVADAEQRALQEARTRQAMLDRREAEVEALKQITSSLSLGI